MTIDSIRQAIGSIFRAMEAHHKELNELDGKLGDGDLGVTLLKAFTELERIKAGLPEDLGQALMQCASAVTKVSSSSFGTLLATGLITSAKSLRGSTAAEWNKTAGILESVVPALLARGKSSLGDKTVVDALAAIAKDIAGQSDPETMAQRPPRPWNARSTNFARSLPRWAAPASSASAPSAWTIREWWRCE